MPGPFFVTQSNPRVTPLSTVHDKQLDADEFQTFGKAISNPNMVYDTHFNDEHSEPNVGQSV